LAADAGGKIGMREIVNAVRIEIVKAGKRMPHAEFGPYAQHLLKPGAQASADRASRIAT
jgi:hypothetical protein